MGRLTPCAARTATLTPPLQTPGNRAQAKFISRSRRSRLTSDFLDASNWCNAANVKRECVFESVCMEMEIRVFRFHGEKKKETMKQWGAINRWDYSRVCMPRVSHNRRKYDVNLTATTVAHRLSLQLSTSWVCANRESGLVTFFPIHVVFPPW